MIAKKAQMKKKNTIALEPGVEFMPKPEGKEQVIKKSLEKVPEKKPERPKQSPKIQQPVPKTNVNKAEKATDTQSKIVHQLPQKITAPKEKSSQAKKQPAKKQIAPEQDLRSPTKAFSAKKESLSQPAPPKMNRNARLSNDNQKTTHLSMTSKKLASDITKTPGTIALSDESFIDLDMNRDRIIEDARYFDKEVEGKYGWGVLGDYDDPDYAHRLLGGVPFAIDSKEKRYFRIFIAENKVQPAMGISAYGTTGVDANDSILPYIVKSAVRKGAIVANVNRLSYYYLFSLDTERYIIAKVINAFEWYIARLKMDSKKTLDFQKNARLRIAVYKATRPGGGKLGVVIPVYFKFKGQKIYLPDKYYHQDAEARSLNIVIDRNDYE